MKKIAGYFFVVFFGSLLVLIFVQDIIAVIQKAKVISSSIQFLEIPNQIYQESIVTIRAFDLCTNLSVPLLKYCECRIISFKNSSFNEQCFAKNITIPHPYEHINGSMLIFYRHVTMILIARSQARADYLNLTCTTENVVFIQHITVPVTWEELVDLFLLNDREEAIEQYLFYAQLFEDRPNDLVSGGHRY